MRSVLLALLLATSLAAFAQPEAIDYSLGLSQGGVAVPGGEVVLAPYVQADWWMRDEQQGFVVRMTVPRGFERTGTCTGELAFDEGTRVLTWTDRLDNEVSAFKSCPLTFRVDPAMRPGATFRLTATLTSSRTDRNPANNTAELTGVVLPSSDLQVVSSSDVRNFPPGTFITYTFAVTNHGPHDAHDVTFHDLMSRYVDFVTFEQTGGPAAFLDTFARETARDCFMPPPCNYYVEASFPILPSGTTATLRLVVRAKPTIEAADIINRVRVASTSVDPTEQNNEAFAVTFAGPNADLALTAMRLPSRTDSELPIVLEVTNDGPDAVNRVTVHQTVAGGYETVEQVTFLSVTTSRGVCSPPELVERIGSPPPPPVWEFECILGALSPGEQATLTVVLERPPGIGPFEHFAFVAPAQNDARPENNASRLEFSPTGGRKRAVRR